MISILPSHIASQIAAGEVIQRPASVIKELMENAVDAGADRIDVTLRDGGATLLQVTDNGSGMSPQDAVLAFKRHATSKLRSVEDLEEIVSFGFRGEALASIASVAHVRLRTRREEDELGTVINLAGSEIESQEEVVCAKGTDICVRNLFYNVPARRRFLKSEQVEMRHILEEFYRVALCRPNITFTLTHNDNTLHHLPAGETLRARITGALGKDLNQQLLEANVETPLVSVKGYVSRPKDTYKRGGHRYLFINGRYFKSPYLHKAIVNGYGPLLPDEKLPTYFLYFTTDPKTVDVNIHPTKTEIRFEDENVIFQMLQALVRETLGRFALGPSIDFDLGGMQHHIPIPPAPGEYVPPPKIDYDPLFDPFKEPEKPQRLFREQPSQLAEAPILPLQKRYLVTLVSGGLMVVHRRRALERIFYEELLPRYKDKQPLPEPLSFPVTPDLQPPLSLLLEESRDHLLHMGFALDDQGRVTGIPAGHPTDQASVTDSVRELLTRLSPVSEQDYADESGLSYGERLAATVARRLAASETRTGSTALGTEKPIYESHFREAEPIYRDKPPAEELLYRDSPPEEEQVYRDSPPTKEEMYSQARVVGLPGKDRMLLERLLACEQPGLTPDGRPCLTVLSTEEIDKYFT